MELRTDDPFAGLQERLAARRTAADVAELVVASLGDIDAALAPVVGRGGVSALFARSVHVAGERHDWLRGDPEPPHSLDVGALRERLAAQDPVHAAAGGSDLLRTLHTLLSGLVGASLTGKLLQPAWSRFVRGTGHNGTSS